MNSQYLKTSKWSNRLKGDSEDDVINTNDANELNALVQIEQDLPPN